MTVSIKETTSIKLDVEIKNRAKEIFKELGITMGEAVNIFLSQVVLHKGLPFEVKIPNEETKKAIEEARSRTREHEKCLKSNAKSNSYWVSFSTF